MKKLLIFVMLFALVLCLCSVFVACNVQTECIHPNGWETIEEQESTCTTVGYKLQVCSECGLEIAIEIPVKTHEYEEVGTTPATCEKDGVKLYRCINCGEEKTETIAALGHKEVIDEAIDPTCTALGKTQGSHCETCNKVFVEQTIISATGHMEKQVSKTDSTCSKTGCIDYECETCGKTWSENLPKLVHNLNDGVVVKKATCETQGCIEYTCLTCGQTVEEVIPATGHADGEVVVTKNPGCLTSGSQSVYCKNCSKVIRTEDVAALGHCKADTGVITKAVTCVDNGSIEYRCTRCEDVIETQTIFTTGHSYGEYETILNPKCEEEGKKVHFCSTCGNKEEIAIPATDHTEDNGTITTEPNCVNNGIKTYHCSVCADELRTESVAPLGHTKSEIGVVIQAATCTADGKTEYHCTRCEEVIETLTVYSDGHNLNDGVISIKPQCSTLGKMLYTCLTCGYQEDAPIPATGHTENEGIVTTQPNCTENGVKTYYCSACAEELRTETIAPLGHTQSEVGIVIQAVTCTENGKTEYHCIRCEKLMDTQTVFATGHTEVPIGEYIAPSCEKQGYSAGVKCSVCNTIIEKQDVLSPVNHNYVGGVCSMCSLEEVYKVEFLSFGKTVAVKEYTVNNHNIIEPELPEVDGYIAKGWSNYSLAGNVTVKGIYEPRTYTVTLYSGYGICETKSVAITFGSIGVQLPIPTYEEYIFVGWALSNMSDSALFTNDNGVSIVSYDYAGNKHLYARYSSPRVEVLLDPDNGSSIIRKGFAYGSAFNYSAPEKEGAIFDGWFTEDGTEYTTSTLIKESVTLIAKWTESKSISTVDELFAIADDPTANYHLTKDITLPNSKKVWTPIETFSGILNGLGHKIINISFTTGDNATNFGFINTNNGVIENLSFSRVTFTQKITNGSNHNSGVISAINNGTIKNCHLLDGTVQYTVDIRSISNEYSLGGISGNNNGVIVLTTNKLLMTGILNAYHWGYYVKTDKMYFAGIAGINKGTISENSYIGQLSVSSVTNGDRDGVANYLHVGGLIGKNYAKINNSYVDVDLSIEATNYGSSWNNCFFGLFAGVNNGGTIMNSFVNGSFNRKGAQTPRIGGFVGLNENKGNIYNCYTTADVNPTSNGYIGGFVGYNDGANIAGCYASGDIYATAGGTMGGFVGVCSNAGGLISNCYSCGNVITTSGTAGLFVGSSSSTISDCYFMSDARLIIDGVEYDVASEFDGAVNGKFCYDMWSDSFLKDDLFWTSEDGWIILTDEDPIFDWEVELFHDYKTYTFEPTCEGYGYTLYLCNDCNRFFIRDVVEPIGHIYDYNNPEIKTATCTESGYVRYVCIREDCAKYSDAYKEKDRIYYESTTDPLGHTHDKENIVTEGVLSDGLPKTYAATCTKDGRTTYICDRCGEEFTVIVEKHGHINLYETISRVEPSCKIVRTYSINEFDVSIKDINYDTDEHILTVGHTAEITCRDCGVIVERSVDIPYETLFTYTYTTEPTCTESGSGKYVCKCGWEEITSNIPALGHTDINNDHRCDECHVLMVDKETALEEGTYTKISDIAGLKAIANDLNGIYQLTANIEWNSDKDGVWTPLGTEDKPFTGMLFGNGKSIIGLKIADTENGGLFGYNNGYIEDITINSPTFVVDGNGTYGAIAAHNAGTIYGAMITGTVIIQSNALLTTDKAMSNSVLYVQNIGGIVGVNEKLGTIDLCTSDASFNVVFDHVASTTFGREHSLIVEYLKSLLNRGLQYKEFVTKSTLTVNFGTICGYMSDHSVINRCTVSGYLNFTGNVIARTEKYAGTAKAELLINKHGVIGNSKANAEPTNCNVSIASTSVAIKQSAENAKFGEIYYDCQTSITLNG